MALHKTLIAAALTTLLVSPFAHAEKIGVTMADSNPWLTLVANGMKAQAAKTKGVTLLVEDAQSDIGRQLSQIQNFTAQKVDAIIIVTVDSLATQKMTKLVTEAGIPLVYVNHPPGETKFPPKVTFVGSNEVDSGTLQTREVCRLLGGKGKILLIDGDLANESALQRSIDVKDVISKPPCTGMKIVDKRTANWSRTEAADLMKNWLSAGTQFDAVISNNDEMAIGAILALKASGHMKKDTIVAGVDATRDALASMKAGELKVTVFQDAYGQGGGGVDAAVKMARGQKVPAAVWIPFELVTPSNVDKYLSKN
ncbi:sugar ABC transporter substrate-binding protein [Rhodoferax sp.]|uniref:sugar ABC transporter substrate-binding protein n=1 Tax=Rhodoferax sp. TaxID=50421 RepID=UPI0025E3B37A|nr:sugar ABC transporter substrate-binding protein [Rhodoferax sp.]